MTALRALLALSFITALGACTPGVKSGIKPESTAAPKQLSATPAAHDSFNAVLWQQTAVEYRVNTIQSFRLAERALQESLADPSLSAAVEQTGAFADLPPAVIVDVDETMLDNSPYQARLIKSGENFTDAGWSAWCHEEAAKGVPGARHFTQFAQKHGVRVFYVSNRDVSLSETTRANLSALKFSDSENLDTFMFRDKAAGFDTKGARRSEIAKRFRIVMLVGDNFGDFHEGYRADRKARLRLSQQFSNYWGSRWIMISNPTYGSWADTLVGFDKAMPAEAQRALKIEQMNLVGRKKKSASQ
jgi:5'-nucleotidase (lipoprotein e(P4) family)